MCCRSSLCRDGPLTNLHFSKLAKQNACRFADASCNPNPVAAMSAATNGKKGSAAAAEEAAEEQIPRILEQKFEEVRALLCRSISTQHNCSQPSTPADYKTFTSAI